MNKRIKRTLVFLLGLGFILLGLIGLILPILQGWLFLMIGLLIFSLYSPWLKERIYWLTKPYPKIHGVVAKAESWIARVIGEI